MTGFFLAEGDGIDARIWVYLIFAALSVIGGLFGKKKKEPPKPPRTESRGEPAGVPRPPLPTPPRVPPTPADVRQDRPTRVPPTGPATPRAPAPRDPRLRPPARPIEARPARPTAPPVRRPVAYPEPVASGPEMVDGERGPELAAYSLGAAPEKPAAAKRGAKLPNSDVTRAQRLLRHKAGLRSAFILSEILAPPVGLRDNHL